MSGRGAKSMTWTVGAVAKLAKVSVHTLHHYDAIDLLRPTARNDAGYRQYTGPDLERRSRSCSSASWVSRLARSVGS
jgi:hypothetical protein